MWRIGWCWGRPASGLILPIVPFKQAAAAYEPSPSARVPTGNWSGFLLLLSRQMCHLMSPPNERNKNRNVSSLCLSILYTISLALSLQHKPLCLLLRVLHHGERSPSTLKDEKKHNAKLQRVAWSGKLFFKNWKRACFVQHLKAYKIHISSWYLCNVLTIIKFLSFLAQNRAPSSGEHNSIDGGAHKRMHVKKHCSRSVLCYKGWWGIVIPKALCTGNQDGAVTDINPPGES